MNIKYYALLLLFVATLVGCGPGAQPPPPSKGKAVGEGCDVSNVCQDGLQCAQNVCIHKRCTQSADPQSNCAVQLGTERDLATCGTDGICRVRQNQIGDKCLSDDACVFGSVCEQEICVETCLSDASCRVVGHRCLSRASNATQKVCAKDTCDTRLDPNAYCKGLLDSPDALCINDTCGFMIKAIGDSCEVDAQCADFCEKGFCAEACTDNSTCGGETCVDRRNKSGKYCEDTTGCQQQPQSDGYCQGLLNEPSAFCTVDGCRSSFQKGNIPFVMISDTSLACQGNVNGQSSFGTDLTFVYLYDENMMLKGIGNLESFVPGMGYPNAFSFVGANLRGEARNIDENYCPVSLGNTKFRNDVVTSIGCQSELRFSFIDKNRTAKFIVPGDFIVVGEFDNTCSNEEKDGDLDRYAVSICECTCEGMCDESPECMTCSLFENSTELSGVQVLQIPPQTK